MFEDEISIVAGGWSFASVKDHSRLRGTVIAVNDAAVHLKRTPDAIVTMDRLWTEYRWIDIVRMGVPFHARRAALKKIAGWESMSFVHPFECDHETCLPSGQSGTINGTNSGACAVALALRREPRQVWLFGFDMGRDKRTGSPYWYPPYPWAPQGGTKDPKYGKWAQQLSELITYRSPGTNVVQVGPSTIPGVWAVPFKEGLK